MLCHNSANYIEASIQSVIDQYYTDWELLIIDDASIDQTVDIAKTFTDDRIKLLSMTTNSGGPAKPRNLGIENVVEE
jgi:teichuronic acid biosynthesis glycosyltransferase TuaG